MILTVTPNVALDVTYRIGRLEAGSSLRVSAVSARAGGKGVNVARVLHALGHDVLVTGQVGGGAGAAVVADLDVAGIPHHLVPVAGETRRTIAVVDADGEATTLLEPGPTIQAAEWSCLVETVRALSARATAVVLSGSLPPGVPVDAYATLVRTVRATGVPVLLDSSGPSLLAGLGAGPTLIKPNLPELRAITPDVAAEGGDELLHRAEALRSLGAQTVVASLGTDGMVAVTDHGAWHARLPEGTHIAGNPTGAGDAAVAALAASAADGSPWPVRLQAAVALSAAAVAHPLAGSIDPDTHQNLLPTVQVHALEFGPHAGTEAS